MLHRIRAWATPPALSAAQRAERLKWFVIESCASVLTLAGVFYGTSTALGSALYLGSLFFWYWLTLGKRLWGLMPLNVAVTFVAAQNLWRATA